MTDKPPIGAAQGGRGATPSSGSSAPGAAGSATAAVEGLRDQASSLLGSAQTSVSGVVDKAKDVALDAAQQQKSAAADKVDEVARAIHGVAGGLEEALPPAAHLVHEAASGIDRLTAELRDRSVEDLARDFNDFARRQPGAVFAGCMLVGFAAARFLKSASPPGSVRRRSPSRPQLPVRSSPAPESYPARAVTGGVGVAAPKASSPGPSSAGENRPGSAGPGGASPGKPREDHTDIHDVAARVARSDPS